MIVILSYLLNVSNEGFNMEAKWNRKFGWVS